MSVEAQRIRRPNKKVKKSKPEPTSCCETHERLCYFSSSHQWEKHFIDEETPSPTGEIKCRDCKGICKSEQK